MFITRNSFGAYELGQGLMTVTTVPKSGRGRGGSEGGSAGCRWKERIEVARTIATGDHAPSL